MIHVKGCSIEDKNTRYVLLTADKLDDNLLFFANWRKSYPYSLWSIENAQDIIDLVEKKELDKARDLIKEAKVIIDYGSEIGEIRLDDEVPDDWYDVWKEFEGFLTNNVHYQGMIEKDVEEEEWL